jgi:hypothetical protein
MFGLLSVFHKVHSWKEDSFTYPSCFKQEQTPDFTFKQMRVEFKAQLLRYIRYIHVFHTRPWVACGYCTGQDPEHPLCARAETASTRRRNQIHTPSSGVWQDTYETHTHTHRGNDTGQDAMPAKQRKEERVQRMVVTLTTPGDWQSWEHAFWWDTRCNKVVLASSAGSTDQQAKEYSEYNVSGENGSSENGVEL